MKPIEKHFYITSKINMITTNPDILYGKQKQNMIGYGIMYEKSSFKTQENRHSKYNVVQK